MAQSASSGLPAEFACGTETTSCLVIDLGSALLKVGFSGQDLPLFEIPTLVGVQDQNAAPSFGAEALDASSLIKPIQRGKLKEAEALESLLHFVLGAKLGLTEVKIPVLCIYSPVLPLAAKTKLVEILFEKFRTPAVALLSSAVAALFSTGETCGLVLEIGDGVAVAAPVFEGFAVPHAAFAAEVAGADITAELRASLEQKLKVKVGLVSANAIKEKFATAMLADAEPRKTVFFELPDGQVIGIPDEIRSECVEPLFQGEQSVARLCVKALETLDAEVQTELVKNVVISGGTTSIANFGNRLRQELVATLKPELAKDLKVHADIQRKRGAWIGGSMFGSLATFARHTITRQDFDEKRTELAALVEQKMI